MKYIPINGLKFTNSFALHWFGVNNRKIVEFDFFTKKDFENLQINLCNYSKDIKDYRSKELTAYVLGISLIIMYIEGIWSFNNLNLEMLLVARRFRAHYWNKIQQLFPRRNDSARVCSKLGGHKRILAMESSVYYCVRQQRFVCVRASSGKCQGRQRRLSAG